MINRYIGHVRHIRRSRRIAFSCDTFAMPRRPPITLPPSIPTPRLPQTPRIPRAPRVPQAPVPQPAPGRLHAAEKARANKTIKAIQKRLKSADAEYYAVGKALATLDKAGVLAAFDATNFDAFLDAHVMPHATAQRYMTVAKAYTEVAALRLGVEKAFHLVQYATVMDTRLSAAQLAQRDSAIGTPKAAARRVEEALGVDATVRVDKKRGLVKLEIRLSDLLA